MTPTLMFLYRSPGSLTDILLGSDEFLNLNLISNCTCFDTWLIGTKIIFVVGSHKYRRLVFPVCRAACPRGMCGMYPFVPCRFNLISVLGCQWKSWAEKADREWNRETAGNPRREVILICARLSLGKEDSCKSSEDAVNMRSLERCSQRVWLKHVNPMAWTRNRGFLFIYNSDLATSRKSRLWSREGGAVIEAVCFRWLFLRFLKGRRGLGVLQKKKRKKKWFLCGLWVGWCWRQSCQHVTLQWLTEGKIKGVII